MKGRVIGWYADRPYAFIRVDGNGRYEPQVFFNDRALEGSAWPELFVGAPVEFDLDADGPKGKRAKTVRLIKEPIT